MSKYKLHKDIEHLSLAHQGRITTGLLKVASKVLANVYKCLDKEKDITYNVISFDEGFKIYVIIPNELERSLNHKALVYYHGGAFIFKGWKSQYQSACEYAKQGHMIVFFVDYRLAFNTNYHDTLNDCIKAYSYVLDNARTYGIDLDNITIGGDSAGGYLTLEVGYDAYLNKKVLPNKYLLIYPVIDPTMSTKSMKEFVDTPVWDARANKVMWDIYLKGNKEESYFNKDISYIKNCYIEVCEFDCLRDEGLLLAETLKTNGCKLSLYKPLGTCHGYDANLKKELVKKGIQERVSFINS